MKTMKGGMLLAIVGLAAASLMSPATRADDTATKQTNVTLSSAEQVPGSVLAAGTYIFKQTGAQSGWAIIQVYSNDGSALMTTILAYPNPKVASNGQNFVTYPANGSGTIPAMEGIIFTGDSTVEQFAYPRTAADQIGAANHTRIPTTGTDDAYPSALPEAATSWSAPVTTNNYAADTSTMNQPAADGSTMAANRAQKLPATASPLPLIGLIGLFSIVGIVILRKALSVS
ncbi:MAG TPA: hypothetical protein VGD60_09450 [Candidatus Acidoferrales bacterium]